MDVPILEYDPDAVDLIRPGLLTRLAGDRLPRVGVVTFLGDDPATDLTLFYASGIARLLTGIGTVALLRRTRQTAKYSR